MTTFEVGDEVEGPSASNYDELVRGTVAFVFSNGDLRLDTGRHVFNGQVRLIRKRAESSPVGDPRPGEIWETDCAGWPTVEVHEVLDGSARCAVSHSTVRGRFSFGADTSCSYRLTRRVSTPSPPSEGEFKVGEHVVCVEEGTGTFIRNGNEYVVTQLYPNMGTVSVAGVAGSHYTSRFRRLTPAASPTPPVEKVAERVDPYRKPEEAAPRWMAEQNAKHAAMKAQWVKEFERGLPKRGKHDWCVDDAPELYST